MTRIHWKAIGKKCLFPPLWLMVLLSIASAVLLTILFVWGIQQTILAYCIYALAFYTLSVVTVFCTVVLPKQMGNIRQWLYARPFFHRCQTDRNYAARVTLHISLFLSLLYALLHLLSWYLSRSWWFLVLTAYYAVLAVMRFLLVRYMGKHPIGVHIRQEWKRARICACILLLVNLSISAAVLMILSQGRGWNYPGMMIYVMAFHTFYATIHAIVEILRHRKRGSPILSTVKIVSLSAALVSMLNLETAMFAQFGNEMAPQHQDLFIILTGAGVSIIILFFSILLICRANKALQNPDNLRNTTKGVYMENNHSFSYTYSAAQQQEVQEIRKKYLPQEEDKMSRLRRLHNTATQKAQVASLVLGIIGALFLGSGMSLFMTDLGQFLGMGTTISMVLGILAGIVGLGLVALAYPVYNRVLTKERQRIAPEVLRLSEELLK